MRARYGAIDSDFYNFDETSFVMSVHYPGLLGHYGSSPTPLVETVAELAKGTER